MKKIVIDIYDKENGILNGMTEINSKELGLIYSNTIEFHGLQSNYDGDDERYIEQMEICSKIVELVKQLENIR